MDVESIRSEIDPASARAGRGQRAEDVDAGGGPVRRRSPPADQPSGGRSQAWPGLAAAQDERSQPRNRELAADRIVEQLREALVVRRKRRPTALQTPRRTALDESAGKTKRLRGPVDD